MNSERQKRQIARFLNGKGTAEVDAFCIYQWAERSHFEGWWDYAISLSSSIPPGSLNDHYHQRLQFLLSECQSNISTTPNERRCSGIRNFDNRLSNTLIDLLINDLGYARQRAEASVAQYLNGKKLKGLFLENREYQMTSHKQAFIKLIEVVLKKNPGKQDKLFDLTGTKRRYFSLNKSEITGIPARVPETDIYAEVNESAPTLWLRARQVLRLYGMDEVPFSLLVIDPDAGSRTSSST